MGATVVRAANEAGASRVLQVKAGGSESPARVYTLSQLRTLTEQEEPFLIDAYLSPKSVNILLGDSGAPNSQQHGGHENHYGSVHVSSPFVRSWAVLSVDSGGST